MHPDVQFLNILKYLEAATIAGELAESAIITPDILKIMVVDWTERNIPVQTMIYEANELRVFVKSELLKELSFSNLSRWKHERQHLL